MLRNINTCLLKKTKGFLIYIYFIPLVIAKYIFKYIPVKKKIVFNNFNGRGFGDNPQYIAEEILRQGLCYDLVWLVKDMNTEMPEGIRKVKYGTIKSSYELSTAKVIINNVKNALPYLKKKEQYYIQTWHGELWLKLVEGECENLLEPKYIKESKADSAITDLLLSGCSIDTETFKKSFWYSGEIMEKGMPRYDLFFKATEKQIIGIKQKLGIKIEYKLALYAPTFRDDGSVDAYNLDLELLIRTLEKKTGDKWVIVVRMHPNASRYICGYSFNERIINGTSISNPQELVLASNLLITDYSSIMVDFMILRKPVLLYVPDLVAYSKMRGFRPIYHQLPFVKVLDNNELNEAISKLDIEKYRLSIKEFVEKNVKSFDNGHASECVVDRIKDVMSNYN